jgi:hypothetical protein
MRSRRRASHSAPQPRDIRSQHCDPQRSRCLQAPLALPLARSRRWGRQRLQVPPSHFDPPCWSIGNLQGGPAATSGYGRYCCKSLFAPLIKKSPGCGHDFRVKIRGTSSPTAKLTGDLGNVIEATKIDDRPPGCPLAGKLSPGDFRLLQQYRSKAVNLRSSIRFPLCPNCGSQNDAQSRRSELGSGVGGGSSARACSLREMSFHRSAGTTC